MKRTAQMEDKKAYNEVYAHCKMERPSFDIVKEYARSKGMKIHAATTEIINAGIKVKRLGEPKEATV